MLDLQPPIPIHIEQPIGVDYADASQELAKRRGGRSSSRRAGIAVGTILILGDGTECRVTWIDHDGTPYCEPIPIK